MRFASGRFRSEKRPFSSSETVRFKAIVLPRQARDKQMQVKLRKPGPFPPAVFHQVSSAARRQPGSGVCTSRRCRWSPRRQHRQHHRRRRVAPAASCLRTVSPGLPRRLGGKQKTVFCAHFYDFSNDLFTKTGLGQETSKIQNFSAGMSTRRRAPGRNRKPAQPHGCGRNGTFSFSIFCL